MPERKYNLTSRYERLDDQITGDVTDSIAIHPAATAPCTCPANTARKTARADMRLGSPAPPRTTRASTPSRSSAAAPNATQ